jgi:hypothetical protein
MIISGNTQLRHGLISRIQARILNSVIGRPGGTTALHLVIVLRTAFCSR